MIRQGTGYDITVSQFSPEGRIFQVDYATRAVDNAGTAVAVRGKDGVLFAVEKSVVCKLYEPAAGRRIFSADRHVGMTITGLLSDGRQLADVAKEECAYHREVYGSAIPVGQLAERVAEYMHAYTLYSALRPFGTTIMMGSWTTEEGAKLYCIDPAGQCFSYWGMSAGKAGTQARTLLEKVDPEKKSCLELTKDAAKIFSQVHEKSKEQPYSLEMSWITEGTGGVHAFVPEETFQRAKDHVSATEVLSELSEDDLTL